MPSHPIASGIILEETVTGFGLKGKGIVKKDNFVIFVKEALPGQKIRLQITKKKKNYAEAKCVEVLKKSPLEIESPYEPMPGCALQNVRYADQLRLKTELVEQTFQHLGGLTDFQMLPILPAPETERYRNKADFSFGYEKMWVERGDDSKKIFHDENPSLGFHPAGKWALVQPVQDCLLISKSLNAIRGIVEKYMKNSNVPVWNPKIHKGFWRNLILREGKNTGEIQIHFIVSKPKDPAFWNPLIAELTEQQPAIQSILVTVHTGWSDAIREPQTTVLFGSESLQEKLGDKMFTISPFAFFQTNTRGTEKLFSVVRNFANLSGNEVILDLFCGAGAIGLFLADNLQKIVGIDSDEHAIADARKNAQQNAAKNAEYFCGKAEKILPEVLEKYPNLDITIVDPPRAGLHPKALQFLATVPTKHLIFVSCNPATLARDLAFLEEKGWKLQRVRPVDMFPHTPHIEIVAKIIKT